MAARTTPFSTYKTYLYRNGSKLIDIKDFPEPFAQREQLDTTVVSSDERTFRPGIRSRSKPLTFTCNYVKADFAALKALEGTPHSFSIVFGSNGDDGVFSFTAYLSVNVEGKGVNEVQEMVISLYPTSAVSFS